MEMIKTKTEGDIEVISFAGNLDIRNSNDIKKKMVDYKPQKEKLKIILENTDNIDLSFMQLLFAFLKRLKEEGKTLDFSQKLDKEYEKIVKESGFLDVFEKLINE
jgi:anti-anti-sigma regulatory factor